MNDNDDHFVRFLNKRYKCDSSSLVWDIKCGISFAKIEHDNDLNERYKALENTVQPSLWYFMYDKTISSLPIASNCIEIKVIEGVTYRGGKISPSNIKTFLKSLEEKKNNKEPFRVDYKPFIIEILERLTGTNAYFHPFD